MQQNFMFKWALKMPWIFAFICGGLYALVLPPFNSSLHSIFTPFPLFSFLILVPFFVCASLPRYRLACYLYGVAVSIGQYYWIALVNAEGVWGLIIFGTFLLCAVLGLYYLLLAWIFRLVSKVAPRAVVVLFPAIWILFDWLRSCGEISFPWMFIGYALTPVLPLAQWASVGGVYGLTFLVLFTNILIFKIVSDGKDCPNVQVAWKKIAGVWVACLLCIAFWGALRVHTFEKKAVQGKQIHAALIQGNMDQNHWGANSLDTSFTITEKLVLSTALDSPDIILLSESALLCFLGKRPSQRDRVARWADSTKAPIILGALDWQSPPPKSAYDYLAYNTAYLFEPGKGIASMYYKMKLVPFSEAMPFEGTFPILSRVNLGEADFKAGTDPALFSVAGVGKVAPFICYEMIFPALIRERAVHGADLFAQITNDGWFGRSSAAYQHAEMARLRSIENGIPLIRSANSGISLALDAVGKIKGKTRLYERTYLMVKVPTQTIPTVYRKFGDWLVVLSMGILACFLLLLFGRVIARGVSNRRSIAAKSPMI